MRRLTGFLFLCSVSAWGQPIPPPTRPAGLTTAVQFNNSGSFGGDAANFQYVASITTPAAPTVGNHGAAGTTHYGYEIALCVPTGCSAGSAEGVTTTGNATLNTSNYNTVALPSCANTPNGTYAIWLDATDHGSLAGGLLITGAACGTTYNHQGANGDAGTPPGADASNGVSIAGNLAIGLPITVATHAACCDGPSSGISQGSNKDIMNASFAATSDTLATGRAYYASNGTVSAPSDILAAKLILAEDFLAYNTSDFGGFGYVASINTGYTPGAGGKIQFLVFDATQTLANSLALTTNDINITPGVTGVGTSQLFQIHSASVAGGSTASELDQNIIAVADGTTADYSANLQFFGRARDGTASPGFQWGLNGHFAGSSNDLDVLCLWDFALSQNLVCANHTNSLLMGANTAIIGANGANYLEFPTLYGGASVSQVLNIISTTGTGTTDAINLKVGTNGGTTGLTVNHNGTITIPASSFSFNGKTCTIVGTAISCS